MPLLLVSLFSLRGEKESKKPTFLFFTEIPGCSKRTIPFPPLFVCFGPAERKIKDFVGRSAGGSWVAWRRLSSHHAHARPIAHRQSRRRHRAHSLVYLSGWLATEKTWAWLVRRRRDASVTRNWSLVRLIRFTVVVGGELACSSSPRTSHVPQKFR